MNKQVVTTLKILFSAGLLALLFSKLDWDFVVQELQGVNGWYIVLFIAFQLLAMAASVKKWQVISQYHSIQFPLWSGFKTYITGTFINNFLPSTIGGDIYRSLWLVRQGADKGKAFSVVVFDRFNGLILTVSLALVMGLFVWQEVGALPHFLTLTYMGLAGAIGALGLVFFLLPQHLVSFIPWNKLRMFFEEAFQYRNGRVWAEVSWWGIVFAFFGLGVSNYLLFLALGYTLPFLAFLGLVFVMALYVSIPISINNIGVKEWAYGVLFILLGVSFETAVTVALLSRVLQTGISLLALPVYILEKKSTILPLQVNPGNDTP